MLFSNFVNDKSTEASTIAVSVASSYVVSRLLGNLNGICA